MEIKQLTGRLSLAYTLIASTTTFTIFSYGSDMLDLLLVMLWQ